jgi:hypothetical protein
MILYISKHNTRSTRRPETTYQDKRDLSLTISFSLLLFTTVCELYYECEFGDVALWLRQDFIRSTRKSTEFTQRVSFPTLERHNGHGKGHTEELVVVHQEKKNGSTVLALLEREGDSYDILTIKLRAYACE